MNIVGMHPKARHQPVLPKMLAHDAAFRSHNVTRLLATDTKEGREAVGVRNPCAKQCQKHCKAEAKQIARDRAEMYADAQRRLDAQVSPEMRIGGAMLRQINPHDYASENPKGGWQHHVARGRQRSHKSPPLVPRTLDMTAQLIGKGLPMQPVHHATDHTASGRFCIDASMVEREAERERQAQRASRVADDLRRAQQQAMQMSMLG